MKPMEKIEKRTIPYSTYLATLGLLTLVEQHNKVVEDLRKALYTTLDVEIDDYGHNDTCDEAMWGEYDAGELLDRLGIEVSPE